MAPKQTDTWFLIQVWLQDVI